LNLSPPLMVRGVMRGRTDCGGAVVIVAMPGEWVFPEGIVRSVGG
jgi:hypothetical protein